MRRFFVIAFALLASIGLEAKGATVKLTITGPGLTAPVEIVEPAILAGSNVFAGSFIGETVDTAPIPQKTPWSADSYKGPFSVKFWVHVDKSGHVDRSVVLEASDPVLIPYFRRAMSAMILRPAQANGAPVESWNEFSLRHYPLISGLLQRHKHGAEPAVCALSCATFACESHFIDAPLPSTPL